MLTALCLAIILVGGLHLRIRHNHFGLPHSYHTDEKRKVAAIHNLLEKNSGNPEYYNHPGFLLYTGAAMAVVTHRLTGLPWNDSTIYLAVRTWVGLLGTLTLIAVFALAREVASPPGPRPPDERNADLAGLVAAGLLAVLPLAVVSSHYIKEDVPLTLWTTLTVLHAVRIVRYGRHRDYLCATAFAALAFATKYSGAIAFLLVLLGHIGRTGARAALGQTWGWLSSWVRQGARRTALIAVLTLTATLVARKHAPAWMWVVLAAGIGLVLLSLGLMIHAWRKGKPPRARRASFLGWWLVLEAVIIFILINPFVLLDTRNFGSGFDYETRHGLYEGHHGIQVSAWDHAWSFHLRRSLMPGMTILPLAAGLLGALLLLLRRDRGAHQIAFAALLWYLIHEASSLKPPPNFDRYMNPVLPLLCAGAGAAWMRSAGGWIRPVPLRTGLTLLLMLLLMAPAAYRSDRLVEQMIPDTRDAALQWCLEPANIAPGKMVLVSAYPPPFEDEETQFAWEYGSYMHIERRDKGPLNLLTGVYPTDEDPRGYLYVDYVLTSSFWTDRYSLFRQEELTAYHEGGKDFYARLESLWGPPVIVFQAPEGPYGFNNPTIRIYARPNRGPVRLASRTDRRGQIVD